MAAPQRPPGQVRRRRSARPSRPPAIYLASGPRTRLQADSPAASVHRPDRRGDHPVELPGPPRSVQATMKFKVGRPTGNPNEFTMIGESAPLVTPTANILNSYFTRIPVKAGDVIGTYNATNTNCARPAGRLRRLASSTATWCHPQRRCSHSALRPQLDVSALLEPDCDNDGFGDRDPGPEYLQLRSKHQHSTRSRHTTTRLAAGHTAGYLQGPRGDHRRFERQRRYERQRRAHRLAR